MDQPGSAILQQFDKQPKRGYTGNLPTELVADVPFHEYALQSLADIPLSFLGSP